MPRILPRSTDKTERLPEPGRPGKRWLGRG
jgi:hypothetical protein